MDSEDFVIFCQDDFMSQSFGVFEDMRQKQELVDFKLHFQNRSITGHRVVLAARIPYFRAVFCASEVSWNEIDMDALELIINFAYSGEIKITQGNVLSLLSTSKVLQLTTVHDACWEFMEKRLHSSSVLEIRKLAQDHLSSKHLDIIDNYIRQNFEEFANSESFLVFPFQQLKDVISRDDIKVSTEAKVFEAIIRWVKYSSSERSDLASELLSLVRMYYLTPEYLIEQVATEKLVISSDICRNLVEEAKTFHLQPAKRSQVCRLPPQPRIYQTYYSLLPGNVPLSNLYALCYSGNQLYVKILNHKIHAWSDISAFSLKQVDAVAELNGTIYIFTVSNIYIFDLKTRHWNTSTNPGSVNVSCAGVVSFNNRIYFVGGLGNESLKVRYFDTSRKTWFDVGSMTRHLHNPGVTSLGELIYVTGGMFALKTSNIVEHYYYRTKKWNELSPMNTGRYDHGCCSLNGKIYVCGGFLNEAMSLPSAELYDPRNNKWNYISHMKDPVYKVSVVSNSGRICAIGRRDKYSLRAGCIEVYDPYDNEWTDEIPLPDGKKSTVYLVNSELK